ncbi:MAG: tyrosine-type recombinase/integrase, partial [Cyanobacteria bacterium J06639_18]
MTNPTRKKNKEYRSREYLTLDEVNTLIECAEGGRKFQLRNSLLLLMMFRHGFRCTEIANLKWDSILWLENKIAISRAKNGLDGVHNLLPDELEKLTELRHNQKSNSPYIFQSERGLPLSEAAIGKLVKRLGETAQLGIKVHPHQFRHACGYYMANKGYTTRDIQAYLGHRNIQNTEKYTALSTARFDN